MQRIPVGVPAPHDCVNGASRRKDPPARTGPLLEDLPNRASAGPRADREPFTGRSVMSAPDKQLTQDKAVVDAYYQAAVRGELTTFGQYVDPDFVTTAPDYLPWGGTHLGAAWFRDNVLAHLLDD